jgi:hypothetical protein
LVGNPFQVFGRRREAAAWGARPARRQICRINCVKPLKLAAKVRAAESFDHLGGAQQDQWGYGKAERGGGLAGFRRMRST